MHPLNKATQLTTRDASTSLTDTDLAELYAYPSLPPTGVVMRANMVGSIDGVATVDGRSGGLGGPGDKQLFMVLRALSDAVVVGARTAFAEGYGTVQPHEGLADLRLRTGQAPTAKLVLLSSSLAIPTDDPLLADSETIIATCASAPADARSRLIDAGAQLIDCGDEHVDPAAVTRHLAAIGAWRVLCEGGPSLLGSLVAADLLDELCVTVSPLLTPGAGKHMTAGDGSGLPMRRLHVLGDDDDYLYVRWVRDQR